MSTLIAGGFEGIYLGMYTKSNAQRISNIADFDWFENVGLDEG